ncbi:MAG: hypothetical protein ACFNLL_00760 [Bacteroides sp.]
MKMHDAHLMGVVRSTLAKTFSVPLYSDGTLKTPFGKNTTDQQDASPA